jgi:DNA polymerase/3'-5' exonuclease PolX
MRLDEAQQHAARLADLLRPACAQVAVVGSVRRGKPDVKDIELLVRPKPPALTFGEPLSQKSPVEVLVARLLRYGQLKPHPEPSKRKNGDRLKCLWWPEGRIQFDLFIADKDGSNWGYLCAVRTGDYEFSRLLVTKRSAGGLMPKGYFGHEGYLRRLNKGIVAVPTEQAFFAVLGIEAPVPAVRHLDLAQRLARQMGRAS